MQCIKQLASKAKNACVERKLIMASLKAQVHADIMNCKECEKLNIAMKIYNAFRRESNKFEKIISFDKETSSITVDEEKLMRLIILVNPGQKNRNVTISKRVIP